MAKNIMLWVIAFLLTASTAVYQKITGPTYPKSGEITLNNQVYSYKLFRSHGGTSNHTVKIEIPDSSLSVMLSWKRYKTDDDYQIQEMKLNDGVYESELPNQPPAGKLQYKIKILNGDEKIVLNNGEDIIIRFKGEVPMWVLIPHIITIFSAMLLSTRTGLEIFRKERQLRKYTNWTIGMLLVGGFLLGPLTQLYAFGAWWTGFPFGTDLTDNKTLIALCGWLLALFMLKRSEKPERWTLFAALLLLVTFLIPHSLMGSELDYNKIDQQKNKIENIK